MGSSSRSQTAIPRSRLSRALSAVTLQEAHLDETAVRVAYRRWAPIYDATFGMFSTKARLNVAEAINQGSGRVLEVGVGTGLSLPTYGRHLDVVGIDLAPEMLDRARERVAGANLDHVSGLYEMDAARLAFPDASFDTAVAMFVMTVVPDPDRVMSELARIVKPGGQVLIVNHFSQTHGIRGAVERGLAPFGDHLGFHPVFDVSRVTGHEKLSLLETRALRPFGFFTMLRLGRRADAG